MALNHEPSETAAVLAELAPELAPHVHRFMHGGADNALIPFAHDYSEASIKLRTLHTRFSEAILRHDDDYKVAVLCTAVRLQAVVLYEAVRRYHHDS